MMLIYFTNRNLFPYLSFIQLFYLKLKEINSKQIFNTKYLELSTGDYMKLIVLWLVHQI